jgi:hypothetical protein
VEWKAAKGRARGLTDSDMALARATGTMRLVCFLALISIASSVNGMDMKSLMKVLVKNSHIIQRYIFVVNWFVLMISSNAVTALLGPVCGLGEIYSCISP